LRARAAVNGMRMSSSTTVDAQGTREPSEPSVEPEST
jgi:hypothetical protein